MSTSNDSTNVIPLRASRFRARSRDRQRHRVLMITEGTYPYAIGGVSSWCDAVIGGLQQIDWEILPLVAGGKRRQQNFALAANARLLRPIELWSEDPPPSRLTRARREPQASICARLLRGLLPWEGGLSTLTEVLVHCRRHPDQIRREFRSRDSWEAYLEALEDVLGGEHDDTLAAPIYDAIEAARLYQMLYWIARTAAVPTPPCSLIHVTAAGWAMIPGLVHKALHGTPLLLTEHGVYVREAYLASVRDTVASPGERHMSTRIALGLTRAAYGVADMIAPVTEANGEWERGLGVDPSKIRVIPNGIHPVGEPTPAPNANRVVVIGRVDPLKDVQTMLLVAQEVIRRMPEARFEYWGPPTAGEELYAAACERMRTELGLGDRFRFMGRTTDPHGVIRSGDLVLMTSISEAMPMTLLEAMAQGRPAVSTGVGGVPGILRGCGIVAAPGDVHGLAGAVVTLLGDPELAAALGRRGYERLHRRYTLDRCASSYRDLIDELIGEVAA
ncbi:MAG: GT4 family glycosyltransferase PelF [Solirubrobacteraceae bacterium]|jgi:glycosyltransferase involved in cell wall biosynthesis